MLVVLHVQRGLSIAGMDISVPLVPMIIVCLGAVVWSAYQAGRRAEALLWCAVLDILPADAQVELFSGINCSTLGGIDDDRREANEHSCD